MTTITLTVPDELGRELRGFDEVTLLDILQKGLTQYRAEETLDTYLPLMQTGDLVNDSHRAKERSQAIIEDQGFAAVALLFTDFLADAVQQTHRSRSSSKIATVQ